MLKRQLLLYVTIVFGFATASFAQIQFNLHWRTSYFYANGDLLNPKISYAVQPTLYLISADTPSARIVAPDGKSFTSVRTETGGVRFITPFSYSSLDSSSLGVFLTGQWLLELEERGEYKNHSFDLFAETPTLVNGAITEYELPSAYPGSFHAEWELGFAPRILSAHLLYPNSSFSTTNLTPTDTSFSTQVNQDPFRFALFSEYTPPRSDLKSTLSNLVGEDGSNRPWALHETVGISATVVFSPTPIPETGTLPAGILACALTLTRMCRRKSSSI